MFKKGPSWVSYSDGVQRLKNGFVLCYDGDDYLFTEDCWIGESKVMSIEEMGRALINVPRQFGRYCWKANSHGLTVL